MVLSSLIAEALAAVADEIRDRQWAMDRAALFPVAARAVATRQAIGYAARRAHEMQAAGPRPGDYLGRAS